MLTLQQFSQEIFAAYPSDAPSKVFMLEKMYAVAQADDQGVMVYTYDPITDSETTYVAEPNYPSEMLIDFLPEQCTMGFLYGLGFTLEPYTI